MKPVFRWTVGNCTDQGIEILCESVRRAVQIYDDEFDWHICHNNLKPKQLVDLVYVSDMYGVKMKKQSSRELPIPQSQMGSPMSGSEFDWDGSRVGGTVWKLCPPRITYNVHEIIMDNDVILTDRIPEIEEFLAANDKCLILQDNVQFYGNFANSVESDVPLNTGLMGLPPNYYFADDISEIFYECQSNYSYEHDLNCLTQADEQGMLAAVISRKDHIVIPNTVIVELLARTSEQRYAGRGGSGATKKHLTSYRRFCESIFSPDRRGYHFCQANRTETHFAWELYKKFQEHGAGILGSYGNKEVERIARRGYIEGHLGSKGLAKNWAETYAARRLNMAKSDLDS